VQLVTNDDTPWCQVEAISRWCRLPHSAACGCDISWQRHLPKLSHGAGACLAAAVSLQGTHRLEEGRSSFGRHTTYSKPIGELGKLDE
jgi:hypothetical protein